MRQVKQWEINVTLLIDSYNTKVASVDSQIQMAESALESAEKGSEEALSHDKNILDLRQKRGIYSKVTISLLELFD